MVVLRGGDAALADIGLRRVERALREADPDLERHELAVATATAGDLSEAVASSLFGGRRLVVVAGLEAAAGALTAELSALAAQWASGPDPDVTLLVRHAGGTGGRAALAAVLAVPGAVAVECTAPKSDRARTDLVTACARSLGVRMDPDAVETLVGAERSDTAELLALTGQLATMATGPRITRADVEVLVGGRREAGGFDIADALIAGEVATALALLRHAQMQRVEPVLIVGAIGSKLRTMARVAAAGRGSGASLARDLGLPPWQIERAQRDLRRWTPQGLAAAIVALADADAEVKGERPGLPAGYALERAAAAVLAAGGS